MASQWRPLQSRFARIFLGSMLIIPVSTRLSCADGAFSKGPQVEYIAPDGKFSSLSAADPSAHQSSAAFVDSTTVSCTLKEGETTFIIELPKNAASDRFTFLNENA